jgi:hypothetical protein
VLFNLKAFNQNINDLFPSQRKKTFVRVKRIVDDESDEEGQERGRDAIANELFEGKFQLILLHNTSFDYLNN